MINELSNEKTEYLQQIENLNNETQRMTNEINIQKENNIKNENEQIAQLNEQISQLVCIYDSIMFMLHPKNKLKKKKVV